MTRKLIILFCLLNLLSIIFIEKLHRDGELLCKLRNLPHRGLGTLYWATQLAPDRADYVKDYLFYYLEAQREELFLEGSNKPVVPMYAVAVARGFPRNADLQKIRAIFMYQHFKQLEEEK